MNFGKNKFVIMIALLYSFLSTILSQLSQSDLTYVTKMILSDQDETTGVFSKSYLTTYKSVQLLKLLGEQIPHQSKICRDLGYELNNPVKLELVELNNLLNCKQEFTNLQNLKEDNFSTLNLSSIFEKVLVMNKLKLEINWRNIYDLLLTFQDANLFYSNVKNGNTNLSSTVQVLHLYTIMHKESSSDVEFSKNVTEQISSTFANILKEFQNLREVKYIFFLICFIFRIWVISLIQAHFLYI